MCVLVSVGGDMCVTVLIYIYTYIAFSGSQSLMSDCLSSLILFLRHILSLNLNRTGSQIG